MSNPNPNPNDDNTTADQFTAILLRYITRRTAQAQRQNANNNTNAPNDDDDDDGSLQGSVSNDDDDDVESPTSDHSDDPNSWTNSFFRSKKKKKSSPKLDLVQDNALNKDQLITQSLGRLKQWIDDKRITSSNVDMYLKYHSQSHSDDNDNKSNDNNNSNSKKRGIIPSSSVCIPYNFTQFMEYRDIGLCSMYNSSAGILSRYSEELFSNNVIERFKGNSRVFCCSFSNDGNVLCCASQDHVIHLIDSSSGCNINKWPIYKQVESQFSGWSIIDVALSPDHQFVAYSGWSSSIYLVNAYGNHELHTSHDLNIRQFNSWGRCCVFGVEFDPNSKKVICALSGGCLILHDLELKQNQFSLPSAHDDDINQATFLDSNIIISGSDDALLRVWDARLKNKCVGGFLGHYQGITCVSTPNDYGSSNYVLSNSKDQSMKLWDLRVMNKLNELVLTRQQLQPTTGSFDYRYRGWNSKQNLCHKKKFRLDKSLVTYRGHSVSRTLCRSGFSPQRSTNGRYVYCGSADSTVYIYNTINAKLYTTLRAHSDIVRDVCWHPYLPIIVSASWDGSVTRWSFKSSKKDCSIKNVKKKKQKIKLTLPNTVGNDDDKTSGDDDDDDDDFDSGSDSDDDEMFDMPIPVNLDMPENLRKRNDYDYW